jgi:hypothetical protein
MAELWISAKVNYFIKARYKVAFSIKDLVNLTSEFSVAKAKNCNISIKNVDVDSMLLTYKVRCKEKGSDPNGHTVKVRFDTDQIIDKSGINDLDVKVSCTCPAFLYWGAQWNLGQGDALEGKPREKYQAPTDPRRFQFVICKHIKIVSDRINPFLKRLLDKYKEKGTEKTLERYEPTTPNVKQVEDEDEVVELNKEKPKPKPVEKPKKEDKVVERTNPVKSY